MPLEPKCIEKHRNQDHLTCGTCSDNLSFELARIDQMEDISRKIIENASRLPEWQPHLGRMAYTVTMIIRETCMNAIEHGILGVDRSQKKKLVEDHGEQYHDWVEMEWTAKKIPLSVTACINNQRILIGVHDGGAGFDATENNLSAISDADLLELSGRGMVILRGMGVKLRWNKEGNTILCLYKRFDD